MEKKKLLLVAVSVGIFLVIVIGVSILVVSPKESPALMARTSPPPIPPGNLSPKPPAVPETPATVDASNMVTKPEGVPGLQPPPAISVQDNVFYIYGENPKAQDGAPSGAAKDESGGAPARVIEVPSPVAAAVPQAEAPVRRPPAAVKPEAAAKPAALSKAAEKPAPRPPATRLYNDYWVQTGAFSTKARADGVKEILAAKGIKSVVDIRDVENKTFYRVRVGPYTSEKEADYWLTLVKTIDGFADSQVRMTQVRR